MYASTGPRSHSWDETLGCTGLAMYLLQEEICAPSLSGKRSVDTEIMHRSEEEKEKERNVPGRASL